MDEILAEDIRWTPRGRTQKGTLMLKAMVATVILGTVAVAGFLDHSTSEAQSGAFAGTVLDLQLRIEVEVTRGDGSFIPPEERTYTARLSWTVPSMSVADTAHVSRVDQATGERSELAALPALPGPMSFDTALTWPLTLTCFEVTLSDGAEVGPPVGVCSAAPPDSRPGAGVEAPTPAPPALGNTSAEGAGGLRGGIALGGVTLAGGLVLALLTYLRLKRTEER